MSYKLRLPSASRNDLPNLKTLNDPPDPKQPRIEFKYLYFQIQKLINRDVKYSFKYEQLKTPELRISLIKPLVTRIIDLSRLRALEGIFKNYASPDTVSNAYESLHLGPNGYGSFPGEEQSGQHISLNVVYVLLLLKYEYMIQSENNLIMYDLLITKSTICELLAIRMLREYNSKDRINLLFINPMKHHNEYEQLKHTTHLDCFNTLELSILSKSKKFLSQPAIVAILEKVYNGELIIKEQDNIDLQSWSDVLRPCRSQKHLNELYHYRGPIDDPKPDPFSEGKFVNYRFNRTTIKKIFVRSNVVPKYQSLVINLKYAFLTLLFLALVFKHKNNLKTNSRDMNSVLSGLFWIMALSFNFDVIVKLLHIEYKFLKKIIWTYVDMLIVFLIDISFVLRILYGLDKIESSTYYNCFSLISILLFPRMLSVFNNYEFFNMIILSLKKMTWNVIAMFCLFISLIFGFFLCFISLTIDMSIYEVGFAMLKVFYGFTPAVWDNWERYNVLGRSVQLAFLSLMQFVVTTILAIVLSNIFAKVSETNKEEFEYLKTTNLIIYLKWASLQMSPKNENKLVAWINYIVKTFKLPIILIIYAYETVTKDHRIISQTQQRSLKNFTFLNRDDDLYADSDMVLVSTLNDNDFDSSSLNLMSRRGSQIVPLRTNSSYDPVSLTSERNHSVSEAKDKNASRVPRPKKRLAPQQSQNTLLGFRSGLVDSLFLDDFLGRKYNVGRLRSNPSEIRLQKMRRRGVSGTKSNQEVIHKLQALENLVQQFFSEQSRYQASSDEFAVREYNKGSRGGDSEDEWLDSNSQDDTSILDSEANVGFVRRENLLTY